MPKPRRGQSVAIDIAGAEAAILGHAQQALASDTMPAVDASPDEWATYCNAAKGRAAEAVIEWGQRVSLAHAAYKQEPQRWGRTWDDWCQQNLGIKRSFANKLVGIGEHLFAGNLFRTAKQILPADTETLYALARLNRDAPAAFEAAVASGTITPQLTREQAQTLLKAAKGGQVALPAAPASQPQFRRFGGITLEAHKADKLEAIAAARNTTPAKLLTEAAEQWLKRQSMPEGVVTIEALVSAD